MHPVLSVPFGFCNQAVHAPGLVHLLCSVPFLQHMVATSPQRHAVRVPRILRAAHQLPTCPHCSALHSQVILELQQLFGHLIPDVEFVIASSDRPMVTLNSTPPYAPVLRFCSSAVHADIQIPIFHL